MSNVRIRYNYSEDGNVLTSRRNFVTADNKTVVVKLNITEKSYQVLDAVSDEVLTSATDVSKNLSVLKIKAKAALQSLGVTFGEEKRDLGTSGES